jgi:threonylcarbamoyladenosine tRNA methylthiotransferase MtaB
MQTPIRHASFKTLGCRLNQAEMEALQARLAGCGIKILPFGESVDLTVINTCTVTQDADRDSRYAIRTAIRKSPRGRIVVTGCYAQMRPDQIRAIDGVDLVLGNDEKPALLKHLGLVEEEVEFPLATFRTRANLKIQDGCDYHCSFCIIPFARGRAQSRDFSAVVRDAEVLVDQGLKEIVLTGVNIGTYYDRASNARFPDLLDKLSLLPGDFRIRISSIEPNTVTNRLLKLMAGREKICPHLHVPIQSGSDVILASMRRKYRRARLERLAREFHHLLPDGSLGTDVIVGFPGETEEDFEKTVMLLEDEAFSYVHVFPYSDREGTISSKLVGHLSKEMIRQRSGILTELSLRLKRRFAQKFVNTFQPVLFEEGEDGLFSGYTPHYLRVRIPSREDLKRPFPSIIPAIFPLARGSDETIPDEA